METSRACGEAAVDAGLKPSPPGRPSSVFSQTNEALTALARAAAAICGAPLAVIRIGGQGNATVSLRSDPMLPATATEERLIDRILHDGTIGTLIQVDLASADDSAGRAGDFVFCAGIVLGSAPGGARGAVCVLDRQGRSLKSSEIAALTELAASASLLMTVPAADLETERLSHIAAVQKHLANADLDLDDFLDAVLIDVGPLMPATGAAVVHASEDGMIIKAASGTVRDGIGINFSLTQSLCGLCVTTGESYIASDCDTDPRVSHPHCDPFDTRSLITAPLSRDGVPFGCLMLASTTRFGFEPAHLHMLELITGMLSAAFERRLRQDNERDLLARQSHTLNALASLERRLRTAMTHSATGMALIAPSGEFLQVNDALCRLLGYSADELLAVNILELSQPEEVSSVINRVDRLIKGEIDTYQVEKLYRRKDGTVATVLQTLSVVRRLDGSAEFVVTEFLDIGARKEAERAAQSAIRRLNEANRLLTMGEQLAQLGHWRFDITANTLFWSQELFRIHGRPEHLGSPSLADAVLYYHPDDRAQVMADFDTALAGGEIYNREWRIIRDDGEIRFVSVIGQCERDTEGHIIGVFGVFQDVTGRKHNEQALAELGIRLRRATHVGRVGVIELEGPDGAISGDDVMRSLFGLDPALENPSSAEWWAAIAPDDVDIVRNYLLACWQGEEINDIEYRVIWPNGEVRYLHSRGSAILDSEDNPIRLIGTSWDVTEHHNLTLQLAAEKERAEQANMAKSNFLAMMSHEIRTPMNGIMGMNALLLLEPNLTPQQRRMAETVRYSADALLRIIDDLLDLSKLEADKIELEAIVFDPNDLIAKAVETMAPRAQQRDLQLSIVSRIGEDTRLVGDPARLRQVVLNLLSNAIKFTETGAVTITVSKLVDSTDKIRLRVDVEDTGIGVPVTARHRLFQPFEQAESSIARRFGGTGLGLSICKQLVERMGGEIGLTDRDGGGSDFWFVIPLRAAPKPSMPEAAPAELPANETTKAEQGRILLVEDNVINIQLTTMVLESRGYSVDIAVDGFEAIEATGRGDYDLILMDMQMPRLDGLSATRRIRALEGNGRKLPIVAMTANAMREDAQRCMEAGMDDYISKPIDSTQLCALVARWIEQGQARNP